MSSRAPSEHVEVSWPPFTVDASIAAETALDDDVGRDSRDPLSESARRSANDALLRVMARSARQGEKLIHRVRFVVTAVCFVIWLLAAHRRLASSDIWIYGICVFSMVISIVLLVALKRRPVTRTFLLLSVLLDASISGSIAFALFFADTGLEMGVPKTIGVWAALLTLVATGFRLSRRVDVVGVVAHAVWMIPLAWLDLTRATAPEYLGRDWAIFGAR
jgi:hypothetical protein